MNKDPKMNGKMPPPPNGKPPMPGTPGGKPGDKKEMSADELRAVMKKNGTQQGRGPGGPMIREKPKDAKGTLLKLIKYIGRSQYSFSVPNDTIEKEVHWYLMMAGSYYSKPQKEEFFEDSGFYKYHEAYHLLKFANERQILERAYSEYQELRKSGLWGTKKYY